MPTEQEKEWVEKMLKQSKETRNAKPQSLSEGVDKDQVEKLTDNIMEKIQRKKV